jgi:RNA polymerase sigma-70 factor (ECF subfamily)
MSPTSQSASEPSTSPSLLVRASQGQSAAWQLLVQLYGPVIYTWARRAGCQSADASDVLQETLAAVARQLPRFDRDRPGATFRGWLWTIVRNKVADLARRRNKNPAVVGGTHMQLRMANVVDASAASDVSLSAMPPTDLASDRSSIVQRALAIVRPRFEESTWTAFWQTTVDGRDIQDVAEELGVSKWSVYKARSRVLQKLREHLDGLDT